MLLVKSAGCLLIQICWIKMDKFRRKKFYLVALEIQTIKKWRICNIETSSSERDCQKQNMQMLFNSYNKKRQKKKKSSKKSKSQKAAFKSEKKSQRQNMRTQFSSFSRRRQKRKKSSRKNSCQRTRLQKKIKPERRVEVSSPTKKQISFYLIMTK